MNSTETRGSLQAIIQTWKDQIICFSPKGDGYNAYVVDSNNNNLINYIHANCDELRHLATNYDSLLVKIKAQYNGYLKEAVLNTIKYETTRRAFKKQHEWIQDSYKISISQKQIDAEQQTKEIQQLKEIISEQKREIATIKRECRGKLAIIKAENIFQQKKAEIEQKNQEIARLNQHLQNCDREINILKSELKNGLNELKLKYKWLITQFIQDRTKKQQVDNHNKSLQSCQNLFKKAQKQIILLQCENKLLQQENANLQSKMKMLRV
ncbi:hypothetical protein [Pleurocapsa sp. PCC 7319]|uniref:hypothetical protein n=1 Tax=Pleurocapsa sp. PCC 7319 TaxID=118161 RepID=UPI000344CEC9|nr:hypothetical protein [Pleurocapsa sp. PCC 7319]